MLLFVVCRDVDAVQNVSVSSAELRWVDVRASVLDAFDGAIGLNADVGVVGRFSMGPAFHFFSGLNNGIETRVTEWGVVGTFFPSAARFETGWISRFGFYWINGTSVSLANSKDRATSANRTANLTGGYEWRIKRTPCLVSTGAGLSWRVQSPRWKTLQPTLELALGVAF